MEWLLVNPHLHAIFASLGSQVGDQYVAHPNCKVTLDHILKKLCQEDRTLRTFRRAIGFSNLIKKDLLQLLIAMKDDRGIVDKTIKLFAELTTPVENLLPVDVMSKTDAGRTTVIELNWLLFSAKESFLVPKATRRVLDHIRMLLDTGIDPGSANEDTLNDCILLLRNILHVPESRPISKGNATSYQNRLIWNLFSQSFDKVLINLATRRQNGKWKIGVVQLVVLLYKDQQEITLQTLLHNWSEETFLSESSEDNESNTSPPDHDSRTSDPTSDSSDASMSEQQHKTVKSPKSSNKKCPNNNNMNRKPFNRNQVIKKPEGCGDRDPAKHPTSACSNSLKTSDSGCDTLEENQEECSTSSNDESPERKAKPVHQKPCNMIQKQRPAVTKQTALTAKEKRELKMRKLHSRALNNALPTGDGYQVLNMNLVHVHNPTNEDVSHILKEFTVDFLLSAYSCIVEDLRCQMVDDRLNLIDSSQFFWLVTYFLKFAIQLELDLENIKPVLSRGVITFLVYQGVFLCEEYENSRLNSDFDMTSRLRKLHLVVTAIRELLLAINAYMNVSYVTSESKQFVSQVQQEVCEMEDLRNLFLIMLRQYNPDIHCKSYLIDLICTNHILIDTIDRRRCAKDHQALLHSHLKQFAAVDIMKQYSYLLGSYSENTPAINDCVFNIMHHVAGDLDSLSTLFQPCIIRTFTLIYENGSQLLDDWSDLIEYVIKQFIASTKSIKTLAKPNDAVVESHSPPINREWPREECDALFWYFVQSANNCDPIGSIIQLYADSDIQNKTRIGLIEQLLKQDIINDTQFNELMAKEPIVAAAIEPETSSVNMKDEFEHLKDHLLSEGMEQMIVWLQKELIKACHAQLTLIRQTESLVEPTSYYYALRNETIPLVPWNSDQYSAMQNHLFLLFLHKLGFLLPADTGQSFARIPKTWPLSTMFNVATKLGPIPSEWIKFDVADIQMVENSDIEVRFPYY
ncbi:Timeless [Nesidiocoris tenuis]|uniref:Timeless n=1 Tax=Nesidiocoris tenuis TaxID=355587 RepID=A0ABN7B2I3_9HEMI|nr:Timeless [Nesidiocoris tenuis]